MGPDFNDDGRVDGYDMEYLSDSAPSSGGDVGCGSIFKLGCLVPAGVMIVGVFVLSGLFYACSALSSI